jgi:hypothetical protein
MATLIDVVLTPLLLCAVLWVRAREATILHAGKPLTADQLALARVVGVAAPERVRVMAVQAVPLPLPLFLQRAAERLRWLSPIAGMTLGYGIVLRSDCADDRRLLAHELAHVAQYERYARIKRDGSYGRGRYSGFLRHYLRECVWPGYPRGPLEREARRAEAVVGPLV